MSTVTVQQAFELALQHHQAGRLAEAETIYRQILAVEPNHVEALHLLGTVALQAGHPAVAVEWIRGALALHPAHPLALSNLGEAHRALGQLDDAVASYRQAVQLQPGNARTLYNLGNALSDLDRLEEAVVVYRQAVALQPDYEDAQNNLGVVLGRQKRWPEALETYERLLQMRPDHAVARSNLGVALARLGRWEEAMAAYRRAIELEPGSPEAHNNLGNALKEQGRLGEAVAAYRQALRLRPDYPDALGNFAIVLAPQGQFAEAIIACQSAIRLRPDHPEAHNQLGIALIEQGRLEEGIAVFRHLLEMHPADGEAQNNLGNAWKDQGRIEDALAAYRRAVELQPDDPRSWSNLIFTQLFTTDAGEKTMAAEQHRWNQQFGGSGRQFHRAHGNDRRPERPLRVGYVSGDFRDHVVGRNILPLLREHDRREVRVLCYSGVTRPDAFTEEFRKLADEWRSTVGVSDEALAALIRADAVDILVDLAQHTAGNRLPVFGYRPAPVQVSFAGYPASAGVEAIEARISDRYLEPESESEAAAERIYRLGSFWCYDPCGLDVAVNALPARANGRVTFGSLNNFCKVTAPMLRLWARILGQVQDSRLLILSAAGSHRQRALEIMGGEGLEGGRAEFVEPRGRRGYLELHHRLDVVLDTFPYNGHTTSLDALWMGVPVVSLAGERAVSRAGLSQLTNLGLPEWVAHSEDEYVEIAGRLAGDLPRLTELRATLRARMEASVLMDAPHFARQIENAYRTMWRQWCAKQTR